MNSIPDLIIEDINLFIKYFVIYGVKFDHKIVSEVYSISEKKHDYTFSQEEIEKLFEVRNYLAGLSIGTNQAIIRKEIELYKKDSNKFIKKTRPIYSKTEKYLLILLTISTFLAVSVSMTNYVSLKNINQSIFSLSGLSNFYNLILLLSFASIGSVFSVLSRLSDNKLIYNQKTYVWHKYILGLISGFVLSEFLSGWFYGDMKYAKIFLAILGGFSSHVVYDIFVLIQDKMINTISAALSILPGERKVNIPKTDNKPL